MRWEAPKKHSKIYKRRIVPVSVETKANVICSSVSYYSYSHREKKLSGFCRHKRICMLVLSISLYAYLVLDTHSIHYSLSISHIEFDQLILAFREFNWINTDFCSCLHCCCCFRSISLLLRQKKKLILYKQKWQLKQYYWIWQLTRAASVIRLAKKMWWHYWSKVYWNFFHSWNSSSKPPPPTVICTCSRKMAQFFCICGSSTMASLPSTLNFSKANLNHRSSHLM